MLLPFIILQFLIILAICPCSKSIPTDPLDPTITTTGCTSSGLPTFEDNFCDLKSGMDNPSDDYQPPYTRASSNGNEDPSTRASSNGNEDPSTRASSNGNEDTFTKLPISQESVNDTHVRLILDGKQSGIIPLDTYKEVLSKHDKLELLYNSEEKFLYDSQKNIVYFSNGSSPILDDKYYLAFNGDNKPLTLILPMKEDVLKLDIFGSENIDEAMKLMKEALEKPNYRIKFQIGSGITTSTGSEMMFFINRATQNSPPTFSMLTKEEYDRHPQQSSGDYQVPLKLENFNNKEQTIQYETDGVKQQTEKSTYLKLSPAVTRIFDLFSKENLFSSVGGHNVDRNKNMAV